jgi:hypothetical protein
METGKRDYAAVSRDLITIRAVRLAHRPFPFQEGVNIIATSRLIPLHINKGKSLMHTLTDRVDYAKNERKTDSGELVKTYACSPESVEEEFMLAKREYDYYSGLSQGKKDVIAYQIRQSFKPGEITPEQALNVGYELAMRFTKGKHQFVVAVHTDRKHIHSHVIFNSTTLDCQRKFKNFWGSAFALRRLSDIICVENGLSIIENPKPSKGRNYGDWLGDAKPLSWSEKIKRKIDEVLPKCKTYDEFIAALKAGGCSVRDDKKYVSVTLPGQGRAIRLKSLKGDYTEAAIRERLAGARIVKTSSSSGTLTHVSLLVDIQSKIREGKSEGYRQWATIFNLKQAAKTLLFLQENGIDSYEDLKKKASSASGDFGTLNTRIVEIEKQQKDIAELQRQIGTYGKTRGIFTKYRESGWSRTYYDAHAADITMYRAAKKFFDKQGYKGKLPSINSLKQEWATLGSEKKSLYGEYHKRKDNARELQIALANAQQILGVDRNAETRETSREKSDRNSHEI